MENIKKFFITLFISALLVAVGPGISHSGNIPDKSQSMGTFVLPEFNFKTADKEHRAGRIVIILGYYKKTTSEKFPEELAKKKHQMIRIIDDHLKSKTSENLEEPTGMTELKDEIQYLFNEILENGQITDVRVSKFIID
jgi:flagellar basal body-associated protein FliL